MKKFLIVLLALLLCLTAFPVAVFADYKHSDHQDLALEAVTEGIVLLKNKENALPLASTEKIALFGGGQIYTASTTSGYQIGGGGSGLVTSMKGTPIDPANALLNAEKEGKISVYQPLTAAYRSNVSYVPTEAMYNDAAAFATTAVMFITRYSKENADIAVSNWYLSDAEKTMMKTLSEKFEKLIVILNTPNVIGTTWSLDGNTDGIEVDALLACYMGGEKGGEGMAKILLGEENPSGKLPHTYAKDIHDYSTTETFLENNGYVNYTEDIYVGYRYFETFAKDKVAYPFGHGLSYTDFSITTNSVTVANNKVTASVTVKNTGAVAGKEVVQLYYSAPQAGTGVAKLSKSAIELATYQKTKLLAPNESETLILTFDVSDMASFDDVGKTGFASHYVLEAGNYDIFVGNSVRNITKAHTFTVSETVAVSEKLSYVGTTLEKRLTSTGEYETLSNGATSTALTVSANKVTWIEAESGTPNTGSPIKTTEKYDGKGYLYDGTKWVAIGSGGVIGNFQRREGDTVKYTLNVERAGTYNVGFVLGNGTDKKGSDGALLPTEEIFSLYVSTDNTIGTKQNVALGVENTRNAGTGEYWFNFKYVNATKSGNIFSVDLPAGEITLTLYVGYTNAGPNIDKFVLIPEGMTYTLSDVVSYYKPQTTTLEIDFNKDNYKGITYADVKAGKATWEELIAQMSLNELLGLTNGHEEGIVDGTGTIGFASNATAEKYGIYSADTADGPAGLRLDAAASISTYWPCSTLQAATYNVALLEEIGKAVGEECLKYNADIWLAPGMNIHRNPLCGRNFEYYSEDPVVAGLSAAAVVTGVQSRGVACTIKHIAVNNKETNRKNSDSRISERALREIYLKGFEIAIEKGDSMCIMNSYNKINGIFASENTALNTGIIRNDWGYEGIIMSDWWTTPDHLVELLSGTNVNMPKTNGNQSSLKAGVKNGTLTREFLEKNAAYILKTLVKLPDHTVHLETVNTIAASGKTTVTADKFSKKAYQTKFEKMGDTLSASYIEYTDEIDGSYGFIEFTVSVETAGKYALTLDYASKNQSAQAFSILVNGKEAPTVKSNLTSTGAWTTFKEVGIGEIFLDKGISTVRIQQIASAAFNYHALSFTLAEAGEHTAHSFDTCISTGDTEHKRVCICGESQLEAHKWDSGVTANGVTTFTCSDCSATKKQTVSTDTPNTEPGNTPSTEPNDTPNTEPNDTPNTEPNDTPNDPADNEPMGAGAIVAIVMGSLAVVAGGATGAFFLIKKKKG